MNEADDTTDGDLPATTPEIEQMKAEVEAIDNEYITVDAIKVIEKTRPIYGVETSRLHALGSFLSSQTTPEHCDVVESFQGKDRSDILHARARAIRAAYLAIAGICRRSDLVVLAGRVLELTCEKGDAE